MLVDYFSFFLFLLRSTTLRAELTGLVQRGLARLAGKLSTTTTRRRRRSRGRGSLGVHHGATTTETVAVGSKGLCVAGLAVDLTVVLSAGRAVEALLALLAAEAGLVPLVAPRAKGALSIVDGLAASRTLLVHAHLFLVKRTLFFFLFLSFFFELCKKIYYFKI